MLYVHKNPCPAEIQEEIDHLTRSQKWQDFPEHPTSEQARRIRTGYFNRLDKSRVRRALIADQHGLCAYCMCRIVNNGSSTTIEHFIPLSKSKAGAMNFDNWLAVCKGGQNIQPRHGESRVICCDAKKSNTITVLNPRNRHHMDNIAYYDDGTIYYQGTSDADYRQIVHDINNIYGLNGKFDAKTRRSQKDTTSGIVKQRKDAYISMFDELMRMEAEGTLTADLVLAFRESLLEEEDWEPFVGVKLHVLDMFLKTLSQI